jgi:hypothetical protein
MIGSGSPKPSPVGSFKPKNPIYPHRTAMKNPVFRIAPVLRHHRRAGVLGLFSSPSSGALELQTRLIFLWSQAQVESTGSRPS